MHEALESRRFLTASFNPVTGIVAVVGTDSADRVEVAVGASTFTVFETTSGQTTQTAFDTSAVVRVDISTLAGADVVILGSTTMHQAAQWLESRLPVPLVNPGPLTYKLAETLLALRLTHSRACYPKPLVPKLPMVRAMLEAAARVA